MCEELHLSLATMGQITAELVRREHEEFILVYRDRDRDEWVLSLNEKLDGLLVVEILQAFQTRMIELVREQQARLFMAADSELARDVSLPNALETPQGTASGTK